MKKAIGLIRVSTDGQAQEGRGGLAAQRAEVERIATTNALDLIEWAELKGVSGTAVLDDPQFQTLRDRIENPEIHAVVVADLDRLMRPEDPGYYSIYRHFSETGTVLYTAAGPKDFRSDRFMMIIESEIAVFERDRIRARTMRAKEVLRRRGRSVSGPVALPYGVSYRNEKTESGDIHGIWEYTSPESTIVKEAYRRFLAGERNFSTIGRELGIHRTLIRRILTNSIYAGRRRYTHRYPGGKAIPRTEEETFGVEVFEQPLIPLTDWRTVQALLTASPRRRPPREEGECVYRGFLTCGSCGRPMNAHHDKRAGWQYRCRDSANLARTCPTGSILRRVIDSEVDTRIEREIADPDRLTALLEAGLTDDGTDIAESDAGQVSSQVSDLHAERGRVTTAFERGFRTLQDAEKRIGEIDAQVEVLEAAEGAARRAVEQNTEEVVEAVTGAFADWSFLGHRHKREILKAMVQSVHVVRAGRARASVKALDLVLPNPGPPSPPIGPRRGTPARVILASTPKA